MKVIHLTGPIILAQGVSGFLTGAVAGVGPATPMIKMTTTTSLRGMDCLEDNEMCNGKEDINKAFNDLKEELRSAAAAGGGDGSRRSRFQQPPPSSWDGFGPTGRGRSSRRRRQRRGGYIFDEEGMPGYYDDRAYDGPSSSYKWKNKEERQEYAQKQREWINKAFDLASDLNEHFTSSIKEKKENEEAFKNVKEWVKAVIGDDNDEDNVNIESKDDSNKGSDDESRSNYFRPRYEVQNTNEIFLVSVDVPGVDKKDIDIEVREDDMILSISGTRRFPSIADESGDDFDKEEIDQSDGKDTQSSFVKKFSEDFTFDETVEMDKISASLENGVLLVRAPKTSPADEDVKQGRAIPIM